MRRRLRFSSVVLISQMLLIALAIAWLVHMVVTTYGSVYFIERDPVILWAEITASALIMIFAIYILAIQIRRLGERRATDRDGSERRK